MSDMVEVVRCKDCKHRPSFEYKDEMWGRGMMLAGRGDFMCPFETVAGVFDYPEESFFCANGKRRVEE